MLYTKNNSDDYKKKKYGMKREQRKLTTTNNNKKTTTATSQQTEVPVACLCANDHNKNSRKTTLLTFLFSFNVLDTDCREHNKIKCKHKNIAPSTISYGMQKKNNCLHFIFGRIIRKLKFGGNICI